MSDTRCAARVINTDPRESEGRPVIKIVYHTDIADDVVVYFIGAQVIGVAAAVINQNTIDRLIVIKRGVVGDVRDLVVEDLNGLLREGADPPCLHVIISDIVGYGRVA